MVIKYRVHEVAKDFDQNTKDVVALLAKSFNGSQNAAEILGFVA